MNKQNEIINGVFHSYLLINHCIQRRKLVPQDITRILYLMHMHSFFFTDSLWQCYLFKSCSCFISLHTNAQLQLCYSLYILRDIDKVYTVIFWYFLILQIVEGKTPL